MTMRCSGRLNLGAFAAVLLNRSGYSCVSSFGLFAPTHRNTVFRQPLSFFSSSSPLADMDSAPSNATTTTPLKVLALHGSGGTAEEFPKRLEALSRALSFHTNEKENLQLEITAVQAPFVKENGFSWWTMPPGVRSFNAKEYNGFEESATKVLKVWENGGFDVVLGHSQGAILVGALLALKRTPYHPPCWSMSLSFSPVAFGAILSRFPRRNRILGETLPLSLLAKYSSSSFSDSRLSE